jgi:dUTP pyrophosphatase
LPRFALVSNHRPTARLPARADAGSAGYDFFLPEDVVLPPGDVKLVFTDVKARMAPDEVLFLTIRSSLAKKGILLANAPGVVDASYYDNPTNEGNIGLLLYNTNSSVYRLWAGDRVAQGIFLRYLTVADDQVLAGQRTGGYGSSGR